jgi:hypothetical protein
MPNFQIWAVRPSRDTNTDFISFSIFISAIAFVKFLWNSVINAASLSPLKAGIVFNCNSHTNFSAGVCFSCLGASCTPPKSIIHQKYPSNDNDEWTVSTFIFIQPAKFVEQVF